MKLGVLWLGVYDQSEKMDVMLISGLALKEFYI